jgi:hypothetical protein
MKYVRIIGVTRRLRSASLVALAVASTCSVSLSRVSIQQAQQPLETTDTQAEKLRRVVRDERLQKNDPKQVIAAIKELGRLRSESAIGDLISVLSFRQTFDWETPSGEDEIQLVTPANRYPATDALFQIGKRALPALAEVVASSDAKSLRSQNAIFTIMSIFREHPEEGVSYLEDKANHAQTPAATARLRAGAAEAKRTWIHK